MSEISWGRRFYWSVRRELWELPAVFVVPAAAGVIVAIAHIIGVLRGARTEMSPSVLAIGLVMVSTYIVAIFYSLDALYTERKDRSILFWKSLPVSDATTVAAKVTIPLLVAPVISFAVSEVTLLFMMLLGYHQQAFLRTSVLLLYHLFAVHALWWAPFFGWLFLVSAWARRAPFVWAAVPIFALTIVERMIFNTSRFSTLLATRFNVSPEVMVPQGKFPIDPMAQMTPVSFLSSPGLWIGLALAVGLFAVAVRLRRHQGAL